MGVKRQEEILCKAAHMFVQNKLDKQLFLRAAELFVLSKKQARDSRDKWKMKKRGLAQ
jgi:1,2-phenylacetyl-CoA epoxidase catalytic subunit